MFTIQADAVLEGTEFSVLARIVGTDQIVLGQESAGPLLVEVFRRGGQHPIYSKTQPESANGIVDLQSGSGWTRPGQFNFRYTFTPSALLADSPPFAFKAPGTYRVVFTHQSSVYDDIKTVAIVPIEGA